MIDIDVGGCEVHIVPVVKGLVSEAEKVKEAMSEREYDCYAVALGIEEVEAVRKRENLPAEYEPVDLDLVYTDRLASFGEVVLPDPSFSTLIDACEEKGVYVTPLDMNDAKFTEMYCKRVKTADFLKERGFARKALRAKIDMSSPESFAVGWDEVVNKIKGYASVSKEREEYIATQIVITARYKKSILAVIEVERTAGIVNLLENGIV
jgi:hypothetical protein